MKKKIMITALSLLLALSAAGCAQKGDNGGSAPQNSDVKTESTAENGTNKAEEKNEKTDENTSYSDNVDMDKVDGEEASSSSDKEEFDGKLTKADVTIEDAKVIDYEDEKVVVVSFKYKNTSDDDQQFTSSLRVSAFQNGGSLRPVVINGVEGVDLMAQTEYVKPGKTITVQKTYRLDDDSDMTVQVEDFVGGNSIADPLVKVFTF